MKYKIYTAITTEPISLAELKEQIRQDSGSFADDSTVYQCLAPASRGVATYTGMAVDVIGKRAIIYVNAGTNQATGTLDVHIEESDDNITFSDWSTAFPQITTANDNQSHEKQYTGSKRYIRAVAVVANAACEFSVDVLTDAGETAEDTLLAMYISAAREYGEDYTGHALATQTVDLYLDDFPDDDKIEWPFGPLVSVTSVKYKDSAGAETTMTVTTDYLMDADTFPGKIFLPYGKSWPSFTPYPYNAITIRAVCGYNGTTCLMPKQYKQALLVHAGLLYKYRDQGIPAEDMKTINTLYGMRRSACF